MYSILRYWLKVLSATPLDHPPHSMHATLYVLLLR